MGKLENLPSQSEPDLVQPYGRADQQFSTQNSGFSTSKSHIAPLISACVHCNTVRKQRIGNNPGFLRPRNVDISDGIPRRSENNESDLRITMWHAPTDIMSWKEKRNTVRFIV